MAITQLKFLLIYPRPLALCIMQYYKKRLDIMELRVQIVRGLEVT